MVALAGMLVSAAIVIYILLGYPSVLAFSQWKRRAPVAKNSEFRCTVTVIMTVYNGASFIRKKLDSILSLDYPAELVQILVVSDGSTDDTEAIVYEYTDRGVNLIRAHHAGKAACLNLAIARARGSILFFTDVRQPLHERAVSHLVANFADPTVGAATGELQLLSGEDGEHRDMGLYWKYELWARRKHSEIDSTFTTTGCLYALRRELAIELPADTLSDDAVLSLNAFFRGYRVIVDPQAIAFDYPAVIGTEFRRRWRNLAGLWQLHARTPALFTSENRMRWHFLSHKLARLVLPWAFLAGIICAAVLPSATWRSILWSSCGLLAGTAVFDRWIPRWMPLKKVSSPLRTFLLMNIASLAGIAVFFIPARNFWKPTQALVDERGFS